VESSDQTDSLSQKTVLQLDYLQLKLQTLSVQDSSLRQEVTLFEKLFVRALQTGDFGLAEFYLSSAKELLRNSKGMPAASEKSAVAEEKPAQDSQPAATENTFYVTTGMDVSRQDFEIVYSGQDSNLLDAVNNPIAAIGTEGNREFPDRISLHWNGIFKYSPDYWLTTLHGTAEKSFQNNQTAQFWMDAERMAYSRDIQLKYSQMYSGFRWQGTLASRFTGFVSDEFLRRRYDRQDENFPDYWRNQFWAGLGFNPGFLTHVQVSAQLEDRRHDIFHEWDYTNRTFSASTHYMTIRQTRVSLQVDRRVLTYPNASSDSTFYLGSYRDWYVNLQAGQGITPWLGLETTAEFTDRKYKKHLTYLQDFDYLSIIPAIKFTLSSSFSFQIGYLNVRKKYRFPVQTESFAPVVNYTVSGLTLSLDFFNRHNFLVSGSISYELRRYDDSGRATAQGFNFYTDQNETTAMLFLSWQFLESWEINVIAHRDAAIDQELKHNNSRLSLFTVELKRGF